MDIIFKNDLKMQTAYEQVVSQFGDIPVINPLKPQDYYLELTETIIGQQLSGKAAQSIINKVKNILGTNWGNTQFILSIEDSILRSAGLSNAKVNYVKNLAQYYLDNQNQFLNIQELSDSEIIKFLTKVKGIGQWTVEMFLIFGLARPDVFSLGDLGLKKGAIKIYGLKPEVSQTELLKLSQSWTPNRSLASRVLWKTLEIK